MVLYALKGMRRIVLRAGRKSISHVSNRHLADVSPILNRYATGMVRHESFSANIFMCANLPYVFLMHKTMGEMMNSKAINYSAKVPEKCNRLMISESVWECLEKQPCKFSHCYGGDMFCKRPTAKTEARPISHSDYSRVKKSSGKVRG